MHGNEWAGQNVNGWWWSEKFDGWRAIWTGTALESRQGKPYNAPPEFLQGLPWFPMDCELWLSRGKTSNDVARAVRTNHWQDLKLMVFDIPILGTIIENNVKMLRSVNLPKHVEVVEYQRVTRQPKEIMHGIVAAGGEGIMARRPMSPYVPYRTDSVLKIKP